MNSKGATLVTDALATLLVNQSYNHSTHDNIHAFDGADLLSSLPPSLSVASILEIGLSGVTDSSSMSLFHPYKKNSVKTKKEITSQMTLNEEMYASQVRQTVIDKLGDYIRTVICEIY